jgi:hypothetical protein
MRRGWIAVLVLPIFMGGCSPSRILKEDDLESALTVAISVASESERFVDSLEERRATAEYARQHPIYLAEELADSIKDLNEGTAEPRLQTRVTECKDQMTELHREVLNLPASFGNSEALRAAKERLARDREQLMQTRSKP